MNCPGFEQLLDYVDGRLDRAVAATVSTHLASGCGVCDGDRAWYQDLKVVAASDDSTAPPTWVLNRALRLFNAPATTTIVGRVASVVASLVFDSLRRPALAGARSSGVEARQLLYRAEDYSIDLQVDVVGQGSAELTGQILRQGELRFESVAGLQLDLILNGGTIDSTITNDRGEFQVSAVDLGSYDLRVDASEASITIVGLPIE